jgi:tetratricopeptide (TPR) repeat protein
MTVISDYKTVPVLRDATFPNDLEAIVSDPANHTLEVVIGLTDVSDVAAFTDPQGGLEVARAALGLAGVLPTRRPDWLRAHVRGFSVSASRLRGVGAVVDSGFMFSLAFRFLKAIPGDHLTERADLSRRVGYLYFQLGALKDGLKHAEQSKLDFERTGDRHGVGCSLVCRGTARAHMRHFDRATEDFRSALSLLDPDLGFNHVWAASINLALALVDGASDSRDLEEGVRQLHRTKLLRSYKQHTIPCLSMLWAEARLLMKLGRHALAQENLREVRVGWRGLDLPYEETITSLDLARCYFEQNLLAENVQLAGEMFPLFTRFRQQDPQAYRALIAFHQATLRGGLRPSLIAEARAAVEVRGLVA